MPNRISLSARMLALRLGVGDLLPDRHAHHGYANGCQCSRCVDRADRFTFLAAHFPFSYAARVAFLDSEARFGDLSHSHG